MPLDGLKLHLDVFRHVKERDRLIIFAFGQHAALKLLDKSFAFFLRRLLLVLQVVTFFVVSFEPLEIHKSCRSSIVTYGTLVRVVVPVEMHSQAVNSAELRAAAATEHYVAQ